jgi:psp operon transcriptional activator
VRELRNVAERAVYRHEDAERPVDEIVFDPFQSPWAPRAGRVEPSLPVARQEDDSAAEETASHPTAYEPPPPTTSDLRGAVANYERALLEDALNRNRFNQRATATALGLSYDQLRHALKRHKLLDASG